MSACVKIIPQSVCSRYGLAIGASVTPFVRVLVWICYPVSFPISKVTHIEHTFSFFYLNKQRKFNFRSFFVLLSFFPCLYVVFQLLDYLLGHRHEALFRRAELKTLVDLHGNEVCISLI